MPQVAQSKLFKRMSDVACPACNSDTPEKRSDFLHFDRHLLPVRFSLCRVCGLGYTSKNLVGKDIDIFYQNFYRDFYENAHTITNTYVYETRDKLKAAYRWLEIRRLIGTEIDSVLEIGSGLGYFLARCRTEGATKLLGLELGATFAKYSQSKLNLGTAVRQCSFLDMGEIGFQPKLITMFHVLEHLENPHLALSTIRALSGPETILVIEVPDLEGNWDELGLVNFHIAHRTYWTRQTLCSLLRCQGFEIVDISQDDADGIYPGNLRVIARLDNRFSEAGLMPPQTFSQYMALLELIRVRLTLPRKLKGVVQALARKVRRIISDGHARAGNAEVR